MGLILTQVSCKYIDSMLGRLQIRFQQMFLAILEGIGNWDPAFDA